MDDYPGNSHTQRERSSAKPEPKKIQPVVQGGVQRRKKPMTRRMGDIFGGKAVFSGVALDVLIPSVRDTAADVLWTIVDRVFYPNGSRSNYQRGSNRSPISQNYRNYQQYSQNSSIRRDPRDDRRPIPDRVRGAHNFEEVILDTRHEADAVLERLYDLLSQYEQVSISDLNELIGSTGPFTDQNWGWTSLNGSRVVRIRSGYLLELPKPEPIER